ncbi:MAG: helix-turn-helix transcriptional regulator [Clostridia bacterium]|nr:helix-turn-helix transcriptional regulator [Clostridia bacterium]
MEKKTMGTFIAALRKANGMTQQELADRLFVSNKAVSRWERDESAPDLSLIPAIAEIFGITCDELLKGERILQESTTPQREVRVEKQVRSLLHRATASFQTLIWISLALSVIGLTLMWGISYGFYRPVIGFAVMMLMETAAFVLAAIAVSKYKGAKQDIELLGSLPDELTESYCFVLSRYSYSAFFAVASVLFLSLPLLLFSQSNYIHSVLAPEIYFTVCFPLILLLLLVLLFRFYAYYEARITGHPYYKKESLELPCQRTLRKMSLIQLLPLLPAGILFVIAPWTLTIPGEDTDEWISITLTLLALACCVLNVISWIIFLSKQTADRRVFVFYGLRNALFIIPTVLLASVHYVGFSYINEAPIGGATSSIELERYDIWHPEYALLALGIALGIYLVFHILIQCLCRKPSEKG